MELGLKELAYLSLVAFMRVFGHFVFLMGSEEDLKNGTPDEDPTGSWLGRLKGTAAFREAAWCGKRDGIKTS